MSSQSQISDNATKILFTEARTHKHFIDKPIPDDLLRALYDTAKFAPTASNTCPMRLVFVKSETQKAKLSSCVMPGNLDKVASAPVIAIVAYDMEFYEALPTLSPHMPYPSKHATSSEAERTEIALRNSSIQSGFLILAARALGLDCGPMSGYRMKALDDAFFKGTTLRSNFIMCLGYGSGENMKPRGARLSFDACCQIV